MKRICFLLTIAPTIDPRREAVLQDVTALSQHTISQIIHLAPPERLRSVFPERLFGLMQLATLKQIEPDVDVFHFFHAHLRDFWFLHWLRKPLVYSVVSGVRSTQPLANSAHLAHIARIVVSNARDERQLRQRRLNNLQLIRSGIAVERFPTLAPLTFTPTEPLRLLHGSAPWTLRAFQHKGFDALLDVMTIMPQLHLTFLWRDSLYMEMMQRIATRDLQQRALVLNQPVDVSALLRQAHAVVLLADDASVVKAYPHSLMEALVSGRPILVSQCIPIADEVRETGAGVVVESLQPQVIRAAIEDLRANYPRLQAAAAAIPPERYAQQAWLTQHLELYNQLANNSRVR
jgi:glycosyltransferase involved in cell wall biosynthesis